MAAQQRWVPLESNPDVMNQYLSNLGVPSEWKMVDVCGLDDELLPMVPQPVASIVLLFPVNEKNKDFMKSQVQKIQDAGQKLSEAVYFSLQTIRNACGTMALLHAVSNNTDKINLDPSKPLQKFIERTKAMSAAERGAELERDESICAAHEASAREGQTQAPDREENVNLHFVTFVEKDGHLYELDGSKPFPINHGKSSSESFLKDAAKVCKDYMARDPNEVRFTVVALTSGDLM